MKKILTKTGFVSKYFLIFVLIFVVVLILCCELFTKRILFFEIHFIFKSEFFFDHKKHKIR
jgi:hypothetical protein